nr:hypothetical protein [Tanacetum cinerariifolium]
MVWRHYDLDINDPALEDGFSMQDVQALTERVIDLRPVPSGLLFQGGLATTWDYPGFHPIFKNTDGNVVTMSEYLHFPFLSGASISKGPALTSQDHALQHTICPLPEGQNIPEKKDHQRRVEVEDPKIVSIRERKARVAAKKKERKKQGGDGVEGSRPKTKRRKTAGRKDGLVASEATSSPKPIWTLNPHQPFGNLVVTAKSREDCSPHASPRDSANHSVHNYSDDHHDLNLGSSGEQSGRALTLINIKVIQPSLECQRINRGPTVDMVATPLRIATQGALYVPGWSIHRRCRVDNPKWCRELMVHLVPLTAQEESNALNNATVLERAWFSLARGSLAQTNILKRKLVQARLDLTHSSHLYTSLSDRHKAFKNEHEGCAGKLEGLENHNRELSQANRVQVLWIKELEMRWLTKTLPLFMLRGSTPWGRGLAEERSEEDLLELIGRMEGFDVHADTKMQVEYDKLFERRYPYVENISRGFCHFVFDLLKFYPDCPPHEQVPPHKPSSEKAPSTSAPLGS